MKLTSYLNTTQNLLIIALLFAVAITSFYGYQAATSFERFNQHWTEHTQETLAREEALTSIRHSLGYGGFIHHFKNFVLRQNDFYLTELTKSQEQLIASIVNYEKFPLSSQEQQAIAKLKAVLNYYFEMIPIAVKGQQQNWSSQQIDQLVKVDDRPAIEAIEALEDAWLVEYRKDSQAFENSLLVSKQVKNYTFIGFLLLAFFVLTTVLVFHRLVNETMARKKLENELFLSQVAIKNSTNAISIADENANIIFTNPAFSQITGYSQNEVLGKNHRILSSGHHDADFYQNLWAEVENTGKWEGEVWNRRKNGEIYPEWKAIIKLPSDNSETGSRYVSIFSDISEQKALENKTLFQATHDPLTKLPNRRLFHDRLNTAILEAKRSNSILAVLFLDLDRFKPINDEYGHAIGDRILIEIAHRISSSLRETDSVCRYGGDEFIVLLTNLSDKYQWRKLAIQLEQVISQPYFIDDKKLTLGVSIGEAVFDQFDQKTSPEHLIGQADEAMYYAKTVKHKKAQ